MAEERPRLHAVKKTGGKKKTAAASSKKKSASPKKKVAVKKTVAKKKSPAASPKKRASPKGPTVAELRATAKTLGLSGYSGLKKAQLVKLIEGAAERPRLHAVAPAKKASPAKKAKSPAKKRGGRRAPRADLMKLSEEILGAGAAASVAAAAKATAKPKARARLHAVGAKKNGLAGRTGVIEERGTAKEPRRSTKLLALPAPPKVGASDKSLAEYIIKIGDKYTDEEIAAMIEGEVPEIRRLLEICTVKDSALAGKICQLMMNMKKNDPWTGFVSRVYSLACKELKRKPCLRRSARLAKGLPTEDEDFYGALFGGAY